MSTEKKVNLFLVGAAKSGTTSLAELLKQHDDIHVPYYKEPFFFIDGNGLEKFDEYINLYKGNESKKYWVDASTGYLSDENTAEKIYKYNSDAKILIVLRNPIDFCFSYWRYMKANGKETLEFEDAISDATQEYRKSEEFKKIIGQWPKSYQYIERGMYYEQVKKYIDVFGQEQVKIIIFENMIRNESDIASIYDLLEIDSNSLTKLPKENASGEVNKVFHFLRFSKKLTFIKKILKSKVSQEKRLAIRKKMISLTTKSSKEVELKYDRGFLEEKFREDVRKLKDLLPDLDFKSWSDF